MQEKMSLENIPGFAPIINGIAQPLPQFLVMQFVRSSPYLVLSLATFMSYSDFFRGINEVPSLILGQLRPVETYDFIVVGGGSSGSVVASKLSQNFRVLLVEGGGDPHPLSYIPAFASSLFNRPQVDWEYKSQPLTSISSGECINIPRSKSLGGSTNFDDMVYMRGNPNDYDSWAAITGDLDWSYSNVRKYFRNIEDYHGNWALAEKNDHGIGGPIHIEKAGYSKGLKYWLDAGVEKGYKNGSDPNDRQSEGFYPLDVMAKRGVRFGTYRGYLEPQKQNKNLVIHRYSTVTQIHFDEEKRAVGVTYFRHAVKQQARADKEIILAAGAINTAKLLLLSGIGPKEELESVGIEQIVDLPVGKNNLQDHVSTIVGPFLINSSESFLASRDLTPAAATQYLSLGTGPFSISNWVSAAGLVSTSSGSPLLPNIVLNMIPAGTDDIFANHIANSYSINRSEFSTFIVENLSKDSHYGMVTLGKPKSKGSVTIGSFDPWHQPRVNLNYFSDIGNLDMNDMIEGIHILVDLYENTTSFRKLDAQLAPTKYPGCEQHEMRSDAYWECLIRALTVSISNPCCTAPMGLPFSPLAVVDSKLKVIGVTGLRIADASVMPEITNTQITAPLIMIGEMCSDLIIKEWPGRQV